VEAAPDRQLRLLRELAETLDEAEIPFWLRGGWALDFLLGRVTREHADVDLVARREHEHDIRELLARAGFAFERELPGVAVDFLREGESFQILLVEDGPGDSLVCHGFESWPFPPGALDLTPRRIGGLACRTLTVDALLHEKETYERHRGRPLRPQDRRSIELLRELRRS
jgi:hypothetical protein